MIRTLRTALAAAFVGGSLFAVVSEPRIEATAEHVHPDAPIPAGATHTFTFDGDSIVTPAEAAILRPDLFAQPELAKSCYISPSTGSWVKATCQQYSGSGSRGFQVIGWAWNGCRTYTKMFGSIGSAPTRSSYIPSSGAGHTLPWPWRIVSSWIYKW